MKKTYLFLAVTAVLLSLTGCASSDAGNRASDEVESAPTADVTPGNDTMDDGTIGDGTMNKIGDDLKDATNDVRDAAGNIIEDAGEAISGQQP